MIWKLFEWFGKRAMDREVEDFLSRMRSMDSEELGLPAALTYEWAATLEEEFGWDLFDPWALISRDPTVPVQIGNLVRQMQSEGQMGLVKATGLLVWAHTIRGAANPALREKVREIWFHIRRGFPHAEQAADDWFTATFNMCDLEHLGRFPDGFTPERK